MENGGDHSLIDRVNTMKRRFARPPLSPSIPDEEPDFIVGKVLKITYSEPIPPGGTHLKYVRGKGLVVVKPSTKKKIAKTR